MIAFSMLRRSIEAAGTIGAAGVFLDSLDEAGTAFYRRLAYLLHASGSYMPCCNELCNSFARRDCKPQKDHSCKVLDFIPPRRKVGSTARQNLRKLMLAHPDTFPLPVHQGTTAIWHLSDLLDWLVEHQGYDVDPILKAASWAARRLNPSLRAAVSP